VSAPASAFDAVISRPAGDVHALRAAYGSFLGAAAGRILLTGHSHQAWPDAAREAMALAFDEAATFVDDKWYRAVMPRASRLGARILTRLGFEPSDAIAFGGSTHELVYRLLSCFARDARVVTTTGEFHSLHRQLSRLEEDGLRVSWVPRTARETLADRLLEAIVPGVDLVALSAVMFEDAFVLPRLREISDAAHAAGATLLIDAYHAFNVVPLQLGSLPAERRVFVTAGGYKYAAFGEGVCFLRVPPACELRPAYTGWFADFAALEAPRAAGAGRSPISYGPDGARFAGATFDPVSLYRAEAALDLFDRFGLDVPALRRISVAQTERITARLAAAGIELSSSPLSHERGGFVTARVPGAAEVATRLRERGVYVDARGDGLRLGPAPYLLDAEIDRGLDAVIETIAAR
jgi:selenocysteine lyase/cysteine desulfurase